MTPAHRLATLVRLLQQHMSKKNAKEQMSNTLDQKSVQNEEVKSLTEVKEEDKSLTAFHEVVMSECNNCQCASIEKL